MTATAPSPLAAASNHAEPAPTRREILRGKRGLLVLIIAFSVMAGVYGWLVPVFEGFDAIEHFTYVTQLRATRRLPVLDNATAQISYEMIAHPPLYYGLAALASIGWPTDEVLDFAAQSRNPYHRKVLSKRQVLTLPNRDPAILAPIYIARAVSWLGGLLAVVATWLLARSLFPRAVTLAFAATAVVALNPQFLFMSATVTNDAWAAGTVGITVALAAYGLQRRLSPRFWLLPGMCAGLAVLAIYSGLLVGVPLLVIFVVLIRDRGWQTGWQILLYGLAGALLVAGFWYIRNLWMYGEIFPLTQMGIAIPTLNRPVPFTWERTLEYVPWLVASYWGVFVSNIAPASYLETTKVFMWLGFAGLIPFLVRRRDPAYANRYLAVILCGLWAAAVSFAILHWTRTVDYGEQGRLGHIAAPAFALLWVMGWQSFWPTRWQPVVHYTVAAFALVLGIWQVNTLYRVYQIPPALDPVPAFDRSYDVTFTPGMRLVGADFPEGAALTPGQALPVTLYFAADTEIEGFYTIFLHLADQKDRMLYAFDGVPAQGRHATRQWRPGEVFADPYTIRVDDIGEAGLATLSLGFYPIQDASERLTAYDAAGQAIGDRVILAPIRLHTEPAAPQAEAEPLARWEEGIALVDAQIEEDEEGWPQAIDLTWRAGDIVQQDYTVFLQVLDAENQVVAQQDRQPQAGQYPTSTWRDGDIIQDTYDLPRPALAEGQGWTRVIVGLYAADGRRLLLTEPQPSQNYFVLIEAEHGDNTSPLD